MSQPLNSFTSVSPESRIDASHSSDFVSVSKRPPKLSEIKKLSERTDLTNSVNGIRSKWSSLPMHYPSRSMTPWDPLHLFPPNPGERNFRSPSSIQFQNCAREILDEIDSLISATIQDNFVSTEEAELPPVASDTVYSILGYAYQQQVSAAGYALQCLANCKVEIAITRSISALSFELHRKQEQVHLRSILDSLDQTFPRGSGERSMPPHVSSGMVEARVKACLRNFRKRVDKVLANSSILDWVKNSPQPQFPQQKSQHVSVISWMMAASSSSSSSSSEDDQSQPVSARRIRSSGHPRDRVGDDPDFFQSISDITFKFSRSNLQQQDSSVLIHSEPSLFKHKDSDSSLPTDYPSTSLEMSKSLNSPGLLRRERTQQMSEPLLHSSSDSPLSGSGVQMRLIKGRRKESLHLVCDPIVESNEPTEPNPSQQDLQGRDHTTQIIAMSRPIRGLLKPVGSFEESNRALGKSVEFVEFAGSEQESVDLDEIAFLEEARNSLMGSQPKLNLPSDSYDVARGMPELFSGSVTANLLSPGDREGTIWEPPGSENFEQAWREFQVAFEADAYSSHHRLRQSSISLNRKIEHMQECLKGMAESVRSLAESLSQERAADKEEEFYSQISFLHSFLEQVVSTSHTVGALTQEYKDNTFFRLCLNYVDKLKAADTHPGNFATLPPPPTGTLGSVTSEPVLLTEESIQACIERYIAQPAQAMKWPAFRFELSKFAAEQAQANTELSLIAKKYEKLIETCKKDLQWHKFAMKLVFVIMLLLLLLILSTENFEKSIYNILVNLRIL